MYLHCTPYIIVLKWVLKPVLGFERGKIIGGRRKLSFREEIRSINFPPNITRVIKPSGLAQPG